VLDRLIAHCHAVSLSRDCKQQRSVISPALLAISVEIAVHVSQHPQPQLSTLEALHLLRIGREQLVALLDEAVRHIA
jgi:hypothetical protein